MNVIPLEDDGSYIPPKFGMYEGEMKQLAEEGALSIEDNYHNGSVRGMNVVQDLTSLARDFGVSMETPSNGKFNLSEEERKALYNEMEEKGLMD